MNPADVLRLLIADKTLNDAEVVISILRNAGHAVRPTHVEDQDALREALTEKQFDLFLCYISLDTLPLESALQYVQQSGRDLPVIAFADSEGANLRRSVMQQGATELATRDDPEHLELVIGRELGHVLDRRRLRRLEKSLHETEKRCSALLDSSRDSIAYVHEGMHLYANRAYLERFGYDNFEEIEGMPLLDMIAPEHQGTFKEKLRALSRGEKDISDIDNLIMLCDNGQMDVSMAFSPASIDGEPCTQILIRDHSSEAVLEKQLDTLTRQDLVTGMLNRVHFQEQLLAALKENMDDGDASVGHGLLYVQIDNAETIRKTIGPTAFDRVMADVAELIRAELDDNCVAGRFEDDVVTVLLPARGVHETVAVAEAIRSRVEDHIVETGDRTVTTTVSVGGVMIGARSGDLDSIISAAVAACETARHNGGNQAHLHSAAAGGEDQKEVEAWADRLDDAFAQDRFFLVYMPVASLGGDTTARYEVRIRLRDEDGSEHGPDHFMGPAERCGIAGRLDRWVISTALATLAKRRSKEQIILFIKISGATLADQKFLAFLKAELARHDMPGKRLNFQVNEPVAVTQLNDARRVFRGLKELGCGFTLDHFGSGLNPFQLVKHLPADYLKLDVSLMQEINDSEEVEERVHGIIDNAHSMRKQVVASFIEDAATLARVWQHKVDFVQGNFLQAPSESMNYDFSGTVI